MKAVYKRRLLKLAEHLERGKLGHEKFNFGVINANAHGAEMKVNGCGTMGCAIGECPIAFPRHWKFEDGQPRLRVGKPEVGSEHEWHHAKENAKIFFGLTGTEAAHLFAPFVQEPQAYGGRPLTDKATPEDVARNIRAFIIRAEVDVQ